jgi:hypothetical protein
MEYGLRIATADSTLNKPEDFCDAALRKLCPDAPLTSLYFHAKGLAPPQSPV